MRVLIKSQVIRALFLLGTLLMALSGWDALYDDFFMSVRYYTYLSNILAGLMLAAELVLTCINLFQKRPPERQLHLPAALKGWVVIAILFAFLTVLFVLSPFQMPSDYIDAVIHYLLPLMTLLEWVLFAPHGKLRFTASLYWAATPAVYYGYVLLLFCCRIRFVHRDLFPYFFMDHLTHGWGMVLGILVFLLVVFFVFGLLLCLVDRLLGRRKEKAE